MKIDNIQMRAIQKVRATLGEVGNKCKYFCFITLIISIDYLKQFDFRIF